MNVAGRIGLAFVVGGVAGWLVENVFFGPEPRFSRSLPYGVPLLPVWGAGAATIAALAPHLRTLPIPARAAVYGSTLGFLEWGAGELENRIGSQKSWEYEGGVRTDFPHILAWAGLGLVTESLIEAVTTKGRE